MISQHNISVSAMREECGNNTCGVCQCEDESGDKEADVSCINLLFGVVADLEVDVLHGALQLGKQRQKKK